MNVRKNCFAWNLEKRKCTAIKAECANCDDCPFYKDREKWLTELDENHGTHDMKTILREYTNEHAHI